MNMHTQSRWAILAAAALFGSTTANAQYIVLTDMNGADVELREEDMNINGDPFWGPLGVPRGINRGAFTDLGTRAKDSTANSGDHTSVMYHKFDISDANGVTNSLLGLADCTPLRLTARNAVDLKWDRTHTLNPYYGSLPADDTNPEFVAFASDPGNYTRVQFNIYGLTNFAHPNYNWSESGIVATWNPVTSPTYGPEGSITWYNAPGITPDSRLSSSQDPGKYNFNSDMELLGTATLNSPGLPHATPLPYPPLAGADSAALPVGGTALLFPDADGKLHDLIEAARLAGQTHVTVAVAFALDSFQNAAGETAQTTPSDFLDFNYLVNPKEMDANLSLPGRQLNDDPIWDLDWSDNAMAPDPTPVGPGPYSAANNDDGRFSPQLWFYISTAGGHWLNASDTDNEWSRGSNWANGWQENSGEVFFDIYDSYTVSLDRDEQAVVMDVNSGWVTLDFNGHDLNADWATIACGAALTLNAGAPGSMLATSSVVVANGGRLSGRGAIGLGAGESFVNAGVVSPGGPFGFFGEEMAGVLAISGGGYVQETSGALHIDLGGAEEGRYDRLDVVGDMVLGGTLSVATLPGFGPRVGDSFDILNWTSLHRTFSTLDLPSLAGGRRWDVSQLYTTGELRVLPPYEADFDEDGDVDGDDLASWRVGFGLTADAGRRQGDADGDRDVDGDDFLAWQRQLGTSGMPTVDPSAAVPEPATLVMLLVAAAGVRLRGAPERSWRCPQINAT